MSNFFSYRFGTHDSRIVPFDRERVMPNTASNALSGIGVYSVNETYSYFQANPRHLKTLQQLTELSDDAIEVLEEKVTQKLEEHRMIDNRCGEETDPCSTLPKNLIKAK